MTNPLNLICSLFLVLGLLSLTTWTQSISPELQKKLDEAEAKEKLSQARRDDLLNKYSVTIPSGLGGSSELDGETIESKIQTYRAIDEISEQIAERVRTSGVRVLYLYDDGEYTRIASYREFVQKVRYINNEYAKCQPRGLAQANSLPGALASAVLSWLPLFKTDTTIKAFSVKLEDAALWASLGEKLEKRGIRLGNPFASNIDFFDPTQFGNSLLLTQIDSAARSRELDGCTNAGYQHKAALDSSVDRMLRQIAMRQAPAKPGMETKTTRKSIIGGIEITEEKTETSEASSPPPPTVSLFDLLITEDFVKKMGAEGIFWIRIKSSEASGSSRIKSNPIVDIFRGGSSIKFSGGAIATYFIIDNDGRVVTSGNVSSYTPYKKAGSIK